MLLIGATSGIGSHLSLILTKQGHEVTAWSSLDLDLNYPDQIFQKDFSSYDLLINCAGHSQGTYQGFLNNSWQNQLSQIMVNYASNLMLLKHYANSRSSGKYVWISTSLLDSARPFHSVYASTKAASKVAIDLIRQEATHIDILEIKVGPTRTNFRFRNFLGTKSHSEVNTMYNQESTLEPEYVADQIAIAINENKSEFYIK